MNVDEHQNEELKQHYQRKGMGIGFALFMPFGVIFWLLLDNPGFLWVGPALGISIGIAIGEAMYKREVLGE
jgi:glycopeptide antibiotics resistance protein